ncbi:MAG: reverse transcriptase-like protein, partial [Candidatus Bathyarchaeota archaeon]|nr:reverse transcriptase-like protein [Candidatus Bathyarchaeota archaeon]
EYRAIIAALQGVSGVKLTIYSDSQLAVRQLSGEYEIRDPKLKILAAKVQQLCQNRAVTFRWIPREKNLAGKILEKLV